MQTLKSWWRDLRAMAHPEAAETELDRELRLHVELETERYIGLGVPPDEARRRALAAFGGVSATKEAYAEGRGMRGLEELVADVRYALRTFGRNPAFAAAAIITLALGIGANTAIFSAVHAVILRPLPFADPGRLVMLWESNPERGWVNETAAPANLLDWREQVKSFQDVGGYASFADNPTLTGVGAPRQLTSITVTGNFWRVLGVRPAVGAGFRDEQTWATGELTAMLSHRLWRESFNGDAAIVGRLIQLNSRDVRVVGVLPAGVEIPGADADIWRPTAWDPAQRTRVSFRRAHWMRPVARLREGVTLPQADAELQTVIARLQRDYPATNTRMGGGLSPLHGFLIGESRGPLVVLLAAVGVLLLIACANVGNLLLVRASGRWRETSLRLALGARRARLVRQALTESVVLSALGGAAGLALGWWCTRLLGALRPAGLLPAGEIAMSWSVLGYVAAVTVVSGLIFGLAPALWSRGRAPTDALREGGRSATGSLRGKRWGEVLLVSEVAMALILTCGAGLLMRSFWKLQRVDPGLDPSGVLTAGITLPGVRYDSVAKIVGFWEQLRRTVGALPGVEGAALVSQLPLTAPSWSSDFSARGWAPDRYGVQVLHREVSPDYITVMRIPLLKGRFVRESDRTGSQQVVVINDVVARRYFRDEDPIGKEIAFDRAPDSTSFWRTIVGVVGSERQSGLAFPPAAEFLAPVSQDVRGGMQVVVRTRGDPMAIAPAVRRVVNNLDPNLALARVRPMDDVRALSAARQRFLMTLLIAFAAVGLTLSVVGVYGVMAHVTRGRTRELGIRVAMGAQAAQVRWLVVRRGLGLTSLGVAAGLAVALSAAKGLRGLLFDVQPLDPLTFAAVPFVLIAASLIACWLPAARAGRSDPMATLRSE